MVIIFTKNMSTPNGYGSRLAISIFVNVYRRNKKEEEEEEEEKEEIT